jgi:flagellar L-ring protein precursor FlgH
MTSGTRISCGLLGGLLVLTVPAAAQNNSLLGRSQPQVGQSQQTQQQVPTTQPATQNASPQIIAEMGARIREAAQEARRVPPRNEVLLNVSPIAVRLPEPEVIGVNDLVTIIVRISKSAKSDAKLDSKKDWSHEWELAKWIRYSDVNGIVPALFTEGIPAVEFEYGNDYQGDGSYDRKDELTTRVQARVIDVKPNGNLVLEAKNDVAFGEESYMVTLTGECRSDDVSPQNTVLSSQVADLAVRVRDHGAVNDASRRGWLMRGLDLMRPF